MLSLSRLFVYLLISLAINGISGVSYNQPKLCPNASWSPNAITYANPSMINEKPYGIFVSSDNTVYMTTQKAHSIQIWLEGNMTQHRTIHNGLSNPMSLFVTESGDIYVNYDSTPDQVHKWTLNATEPSIVMNVSKNCAGLFIDVNNSLYCSSRVNHRVIRASPLNGMNPPTPMIVAGNGILGNASNQLNRPHGIFVDDNLTLYVADHDNHRIQRFCSQQEGGETVIGNNEKLNGPTAIVLDANNYLYVADSGNNRIVVFKSTGSQCLVGCSGPGATSRQLHSPWALSFDNHGNLFVTDTDNYRIQKFVLATNSCYETTTLEPICQLSTAVQSTLNPTTANQRDSTVTSASLATTTGSMASLSTATISTCNNSTIGLACNISNTPCISSDPCKNNGICVNNNTAPYGYKCLCLHGFNGTRCELDYRPCKPNTCWNDGICNETSNTTFSCLCKPGWDGNHCETKINYCWNITCRNNGVCRPSFKNYTCECLGNSYSGRHCEITAMKINIYKIVSKSFAYVAIIALISFGMFIVIMDILKYCFGIDPVHEERERIRRKNQLKKRKPIIQKFVYVNAPSTTTETVA